ncbi:MAG: penicillin-binding protein 2 [Pseudomonadota bacterium]
MIRVPLRPLAKIIAARAQGEDPDVEEAERRARNLRKARTRERKRAENRLVIVATIMAVAFGAVGLRMASMSLTDPASTVRAASAELLRADRADIVDRHGAVLATNAPATSVYVETRQMVDRARVAEGLGEIFPWLDAATLTRRFEGAGNFHWIAHRVSPEQAQAVHDLGQPGVFFGPRQVRVYPAGAAASHIVGGARFERVSAEAAEIIGKSGLELAFNERLSSPGETAEPLRLSLDLRLQSAMREVLASEMARQTAIGASGIFMDAHTGEILAMVSLPDFDPNDPPYGREGGDAQLFNRAAQGVYELGSTFKPFQAAIAMEAGAATPETLIETQGPLRWGRFRISDIHQMDPEMPLADVIVQSSNVGTARLAQLTGIEAQQRYLARLGLLTTTGVELPEARTARPIYPANWSELSMMTISYGHGISVSPLHLAAAYAPFANGGHMVQPTLLAGEGDLGERVISEETAAQILEMMRRVVDEPAGTANFAAVPGYAVAGKTGTAEKPSASGGYDEDKVISTFAGVFPADDPRYVLVLTLDEPEVQVGRVTKRTAGWTAAPASARLLRRLVPILNMRPAREVPSGAPASLLFTSAPAQ